MEQLCPTCGMDLYTFTNARMVDLHYQTHHLADEVKRLAYIARCDRANCIFHAVRRGDVQIVREKPPDRRLFRGNLSETELLARLREMGCEVT